MPKNLEQMVGPFADVAHYALSNVDQRPVPRSDAHISSRQTVGEFSRPTIDITPNEPAVGDRELPNSHRHSENPMERLRSRLEREAPAGLERLLALLDTKQTAFAAYRAFDEDIEAARRNIDTFTRDLRRMERDLRRPNGKMPDPMPEEVVRITQKIEALKHEIDRYDSRRAPHLKTAQGIGGVINNLERYVRDGADGKYSEAKRQKITKGATIESVSQTIADLQADLAEIESRPWPAEDAKKRAEAELEFLARHGRVRVEQSVAHRNQLKWPTAPVAYETFGKNFQRGGDYFDRKEASPELALVVWANLDAIKAKIFADIDAMADPDRAMTWEQRAAARARMRGELLAEERQLAEIIWRDNAHDLWPDDIDARAILGIEGPELREL